MEEDKIVECATCGNIHKWSERKIIVKPNWTCYYCPKCGDESYVEPKNINKL